MFCAEHKPAVNRCAVNTATLFGQRPNATGAPLRDDASLLRHLPEGFSASRCTILTPDTFPTKGGDPAALSSTATLLRLHPPYQAYLRHRPPLQVRQMTSGTPNSGGVTGGVYKARERIHRAMLMRDY